MTDAEPLRTERRAIGAVKFRCYHGRAPVQADAAFERDDGALSIHAGWKGNIAKQGLGKPAAGH